MTDPLDIAESFVPVEVAAEPEPVPAPPKKISREDFLEIESLSLKVQNMALQHKQLQDDVIKAVQMRKDMQQELSDMVTRLSAKYGVDLTKVQILPDGTIRA